MEHTSNKNDQNNLTVLDTQYVENKEIIILDTTNMSYDEEER